jgi:Tol biopolymer transport system component
MLKLNDISRDGQHVLLTRGTTRGRIAGLANGAAERDLSWFDYSTVADLSPDGRTLLFYEWGEGVGAVPTIFIRSTEGSDAVQLGEGKPLALSPDARSVVALEGNESRQLIVLPAGTGDVKRMPRGSIVEYLDWAAWSRDGRRIYFAGRDAADVRRTYVQDVDGGEPRPITPDGFVGMALSPDGRTVAAVDRYGEYYLCAIDERAEPRPLPGYRDGDLPLQWSSDGRSRRRQPDAADLYARCDDRCPPLLEGTGAHGSGRADRYRNRSRGDPADAGREVVRLHVLDVRGRAVPRAGPQIAVSLT